MLAGGVLALILAVCAALLLTTGSSTAQGGGSPAKPAEDSAAVGFARDMSVHHAQAVEMSFLVRERSDAKDVGTLAYDIINTQANQRGMMLGWLDMWGRSATTTKPPMAWLGMAPPSAADRKQGVLMDGMASRSELAELRGARPKAAEVLFLQLMIDHHKGGVHMAEGLLASEKVPTVERRLAKGMVAAQRSEIELMKDLLKKRGAKARG
jgi:uncharacterized protein (DUF305 family)